MAFVDASDDVVGVSAEGAGHGERGLDHLGGQIALAVPDRVDRARSAGPDLFDDLFGMGADRGRHRGGRVGELRRDRAPCLRIDCTASELVAAMRVTTASAWAPMAARVSSAVAARRAVTPPPWVRIASTSPFPLVLKRSTSSSERARRARWKSSRMSSASRATVESAVWRYGLFVGTGARIGDAFDDVVGMAADRRPGLVRGLGQARGHAAAVGPNSLDDLGPARLQPVDQFVGARGERGRHGRRDVGQPDRRQIPMDLDGLGRAPLHLRDPVDDVVGECADRLAGVGGRVRDPRGHAVAVRADRVDDLGLRSIDALDENAAALVHPGEQGFAGGLHAAVEVADAGHNVVGRPAAGFRETGGETVADAGDRDCDLRAFRHDALDGVRAGAVHRDRDVLRRRAERSGEPLAGFVQLLAQAIARSVEISGDTAVGVCDRIADREPLVTIASR